MTLAESAAYLRSTGLYSEREIRERVERIATRKVLEQIAAISNLHPTFAQAVRETASMTIRGYDDWKTDSGYAERSSVEEDLANELADAKDEIKRLKAALDLAMEYFDQRADADCDQDGFIPNEEMKIMTALEEALGKGGY